MAETLDSLGEKIATLTQKVDGIDGRFDTLRSELKTQIEAVDTKVGLVLEKVTDLIVRDARNSAAHARLETRLDDHELRILALEHPKPATEIDQS